MPICAKRPKRELCPEGIHKAYVANVEATKHEEYGKRIRLSFDLMDLEQEDGSPLRVFRECSFKLTPKAKLTEVVEAILGRKLDEAEVCEGEGFDLEGLIGSVVQVVIKHREGSSGNIYAVVETIVHLDEAPVEVDNLPF